MPTKKATPIYEMALLHLKKNQAVGAVESTNTRVESSLSNK